MISAVQTATSAASAASATGTSNASVDYDAFLQLLVAQLKNQDPTEPMDSTEYVAQLATFSNVEQSTKINQRLDQLITMSGLEQATGLIGKSFTSYDGAQSGRIEAVRILTDGVSAILDNGQEVLVTPGSFITE